MTNSERIRLLLHLFAGGGVALSAILVDYILGHPLALGAYQLLTLVVGLSIIVLGFVPNSRLVSGASTKFCLSVLSLFVILALCEGFFRAIGFDFAREERAWRDVPIYYRLPIVPTGEVFFRRPGPESWTGQVLNSRLMQLHIVPNPYSDEPMITVKYNKVGFRNRDDISDWDITVTGDSFTELGYLRDEELFTTILGEILNVRVLNLGVSYTGPLTQLSYLRSYGVSKSTKHAVVVFFEGNDLDDLVMEHESLIHWRESGQRDERNFKKQPSVIKTLVQHLQVWVSGHLSAPTDHVNAYFKSPHGDIPVSLSYAPPDRSEIPEETIQSLNYFFGEYADFGTERQIMVWLAYMPSKRRILEDQIQFVDGADEKIRNWRPTDLPNLISELCDQYGIRFIDLTPALVEDTKNKRHLVYNSIYDTHLNALGALIVGREMANRLATQSPRSPN